MSDPNINETPEQVQETPVVSPEARKAELQAKVDAGKAEMEKAKAALSAPISDLLTDPNEPQTVETPTTVESGNKAQPEPLRVPENVSTPEGNVDVEKLQKATEQLEIGLEQKRQMLEKYRQMQREMTEVGQEARQVKEKVLEQPKKEEGPPLPSSLTEYKETIRKMLEEDPTKAFEYVLMQSRNIAAAEWDKRTKEQELVKRKEAWLAKLDEHAKDSPWVYTEEGQAAIQKALSTRPYLYQGTDPYGEALAFVDKSKFSQGTANFKAPTPSVPVVTGRNMAVPPPATNAVPSYQQKLAELQTQWKLARGDSKAQRRIMNEMDMVAKEQLVNARLQDR